MSTRATIEIEGIKYAKVYKHCDGYPEATLEWLQDFNKTFNTKRGDDPQYKFAQLLRSSAREADRYDLDPSDVTGWGVAPYDANMWQEYNYLLKADGTVEVEEIN
jgi:hypothetical protein